ncbi:hypothetical protein HDK90DRAFT_317409 [Phyllosticta capitalensis]|uniref:Secreted protein n=1 Tax=Phyllosticta capitalensis TaxID=121624 RepID=A0ABR1YHF6_9PEZI
MNRDVQSSMSFLAIVVCVSRPVRFSLVVVCNVQLARMRGFHHPLLTQKGPLHFVVHKANKSDSKSSVPQLCIHMVIWLVSFRKLRPSTSSSSRIQSSPVQSADRPLHQPARQTDRHRAPSPRSLTNASICCCSASLRPLFSTHRSHQTRINKSRPTLARPPGSRRGIARASHLLWYRPPGCWLRRDGGLRTEMRLRQERAGRWFEVYLRSSQSGVLVVCVRCGYWAKGPEAAGSCIARLDVSNSPVHLITTSLHQAGIEVEGVCKCQMSCQT